MTITGNVHLLFEQSGTYKKVFRDLGITAYDYDICNDFGCTDFQLDLFKDIANAFQGWPSIFDRFDSHDLVLAFFPCTYFSSNNYLFFQGTNAKWKMIPTLEKLRRIRERAVSRQQFYDTLLQLLIVAERSQLRLIIENPYKDNFLVKNLPYVPYVDLNRRLRGDVFTKPTMYYFINCQPTNLQSVQLDKVKKYVQAIRGDDLSRSLITEDYARNFVCDCILGKYQRFTNLTLFDDETNHN